MSTTERLALPLLTPGQAQKEFFHNEALQALDALVAGCVEEGPRNDPPTAPVPGSVYLVGDAPTGEWDGHAGALAAWTSGGWRFQAGGEGMTQRLRTSGLTAAYRGGAWEVGAVRGSSFTVNGIKVVGSQQTAIAAPAGGTVVDTQARSAISAILTALRAHGLIAS